MEAEGETRERAKEGETEVWLHHFSPQTVDQCFSTYSLKWNPLQQF